MSAARSTRASSSPIWLRVLADGIVIMAPLGDVTYATTLRPLAPPSRPGSFVTITDEQARVES